MCLHQVCETFAHTKLFRMTVLIMLHWNYYALLVYEHIPVVMYTCVWMWVVTMNIWQTSSLGLSEMC